MFSYLLFLQENPSACPKTNTCNYVKPIKRYTKYEMIRDLQEQCPNNSIVLTLDQRKPPDKLWLEYVFGHLLPSHHIYVPNKLEDREFTMPYMDETLSTIGKFKRSNDSPHKRRGIFARHYKKNEDKKLKSLKLINDLETIARRQIKFNNDQKNLKSDFKNTLDELKSLSASIKFDYSDLKSTNLNYSLNEMNQIFNNN